MEKLKRLDLGSKWGGGELKGNIINVSKVSDYIVHSQDTIRNIVEQVLKLSYFSPEYQAWRPFISIYLGSAVDLELTSKWNQVLYDNDNSVLPKVNITSFVVASYLKMKSTSCNTIFDSITIEDINFLISCAQIICDSNNWRLLLRELSHDKTFDDTLSDLLNEKDLDRSIWYAFYTLVLRKQFCGSYSINIQNKILPYLNNWNKRFKHEFIKAQKFVKDRIHFYTIYCDEVKETLFRLRDSEIQYLNTGVALNIQDIYGASLNIDNITSEWVLEYVTHSPIYISREYKLYDVWNILYEYYFDKDASISDFCDLLIINKSTYKKIYIKLKEMLEYFTTTDIGFDCIRYKKISLFNKKVSPNNFREELEDYFYDLCDRGLTDTSKKELFLNAPI